MSDADYEKLRAMDAIAHIRKGHIVWAPWSLLMPDDKDDHEWWIDLGGEA